MNSTVFYYCKVVLVASLVLFGVAILIGYEEMTYLIKQRPAAVLKIASYITLVIPFILPSLKKRGTINLQHSLRRCKSVIGRSLPNFLSFKQEPANVEAKKRVYISPNDIQRLGIRLGRLVYESIDEFEPTWLISIVDDVPLGIYIHRFLTSKGVKVNYGAIQDTTSNLDHVAQHCNSIDKLLIVVNVFDGGRSVQACLDRLRLCMRSNFPTEIRIATAFEKPCRNTTSLIPHYVGKKTSDWLVFGHDLHVMADEDCNLIMGNDVHQEYTGNIVI